MLIKSILLSALVIVVVVIAIDVIRVYSLARRSKVLMESAKPFERAVAEPSMKILVLGDSTAVGTGSERPELTTGGRLGTMYPDASVRNISKNGMKLAGLLEEVRALGENETYDLVLVQVGANDIIRLTARRNIERDAATLLGILSRKSVKVIILHSGNVGEAGLFPWYIKPLMSKRSYMMRDIYSELVAHHENVVYVDLIDGPAGELLKNDPAKYYASDRLHLSGAGYGLWFDEIRKAGDLK